MTQRILIGDDHPLVRMALAQAAAQAAPGCAVEGCSSLDETLSRIESDPSTVDLVMLDLNMPGAHGLGGLMLVQALFPTIPVAIVSAIETPDVIRTALTQGAAGYVPKSSSFDDVRAAVDAMLQGEIWSPPCFLLSERVLPGEGDFDNLSERLGSLSPQQLRILNGIADGKLNKQIAFDLGIAEQTVKAHVSAILRKLDVPSRTGAALLMQRLQPRASIW